MLYSVPENPKEIQQKDQEALKPYKTYIGHDDDNP